MTFCALSSAKGMDIKMEEGDECWFAQIDGEPQIVA